MESIQADEIKKVTILVRKVLLVLTLAVGTGLAHATAICTLPEFTEVNVSALEFGPCLAGCSPQHHATDSECAPDTISGSAPEPLLLSRTLVTEIPAPLVLATPTTTYPRPFAKVPRYLTYHRLLIAHLA